MIGLEKYDFKFKKIDTHYTSPIHIYSRQFRGTSKTIHSWNDK